MYDYNTLDGKIRRVEELRKLQSRVACVPGNFINYTEAYSINHYLGDIISDLEKQINKEQKAKRDIIRDKVAKVNKALFEYWGTEKAETLWDELEKCATEEEIAQLYDLIFKSDDPI